MLLDLRHVTQFVLRNRLADIGAKVVRGSVYAMSFVYLTAKNPTRGARLLPPIFGLEQTSE